MAITSYPYAPALLGLGTGVWNFNTDTFNVMLVGVGYTLDGDLHDFLDDVSAEIVGTGYTAGGQALTGLTWTWDTVNQRAVLTADSVVWSTTTLVNVRYAVVYRPDVSPAAARLLSYVDFGTAVSPTAQDFVVDFSIQGLFWLDKVIA